ncbi:putative metal-dependent HD superfamily phosphohydrolase [Marinobacter sp. MBR-99]|jgi:predicted metal-dependent HD superfamily phosphohydrolase
MRGLNMMNQNRWQTLMSAMGLPPSKLCYDALHAAYSEKRRFYHTVDHIDAMLTHFDGVKDIAERPEELELAIWFHDAIYKPLSKTNELDSANWAQEFLASRGYGEAGIERVHNLIMATLHNGSVKGQDEQIIVDIDLAILGASPGVYDQFERNVRKEYRLVPWFIYRKKRKELLQSFLDRSGIYNLGSFKDRFERVARDNLNRTIGTL